MRRIGPALWCVSFCPALLLLGLEVSLADLASCTVTCVQCDGACKEIQDTTTIAQMGCWHYDQPYALGGPRPDATFADYCILQPTTGGTRTQHATLKVKWFSTQGCEPDCSDCTTDYQSASAGNNPGFIADIPFWFCNNPPPPG